MTEKAAQIVYDVLDNLGVSYSVHHHAPCFTVEQAKTCGLNRPGINVKNLIIWDKKIQKYFMVVLTDDRRLDFKQLVKVTGWSNKATFASDEDIYRLLGVHIGSCSVFGIINDKENHVTVVLEKAIGNAKADDIINFHPNINTSTVSLQIGDLHRFLEWSGNQVLIEP